MHIVTNFERFPAKWSASNGVTGTSERCVDTASFAKAGANANSVYVVNCDIELALALAAQSIKSPRSARPMVGVDFVLRRPNGLRARATTAVKRALFSRFKLFINYFKDTEGLDRYFGIGERRSMFVPFKANLWQYRVQQPDIEGEYILCFGRSLRDYDTFFEAIERANLPGAITDPRTSGVWHHLSRFTRPLDALPANVRMLPDDMSDDSQARLLAAARVVVVPIVRGSLVASGIGTILNAMALGKCVVATSGPGVSDLFVDEILIAPTEDPDALAATLTRAWNDDSLRERTAQRGIEYVSECRGEEELLQRIVDAVAARLTPR